MNLPSIGLVGPQLNHIRELNTKALISNYFGNHLYPKNSLMGHFWTWFYQGNPELEKELKSRIHPCQSPL